MHEVRMESMVKTWIGQSLHERFDHVVEEPVPEAFMRFLDGMESDNEICSAVAE